MIFKIIYAFVATLVGMLIYGSIIVVTAFNNSNRFLADAGAEGNVNDILMFSEVYNETPLFTMQDETYSMYVYETLQIVDRESVVVLTILFMNVAEEHYIIDDLSEDKSKLVVSCGDETVTVNNLFETYTAFDFSMKWLIENNEVNASEDKLPNTCIENKKVDSVTLYNSSGALVNTDSDGFELINDVDTLLENGKPGITRAEADAIKFPNGKYSIVILPLVLYVSVVIGLWLVITKIIIRKIMKSATK